MSRVIVTDISASVSEKTVKDFFLFCGKIKEFELVKEEASDKQIAYVTFEREQAAKTALMLSKAVIGDSYITVRADDSETLQTSDESYDIRDELSQEEKPKSAIFAEILGAGYQLQDHIIEKGLEYDSIYGISNRFKSICDQIIANLQQLNTKYRVVETVTEKVTEIEQKFAVQDKVQKAAAQVQHSSIGKRVAEFYTSTQRTVADVHKEARQIADEKKAARDPNVQLTIEAH